jgi:hypothetical protein
MVFETDDMSVAQLYFEMVRKAIVGYMDDLCKMHNRDPRVAWDRLSVITKTNCDGTIGNA